MMANVPHVTSDLGLRKFQADGFLLTRVYNTDNLQQNARFCEGCTGLLAGPRGGSSTATPPFLFSKV